MWISVNDPSAGSPTETLLRLLLPLSDMVYLTFHTKHEARRGPKGLGNLVTVCRDRDRLLQLLILNEEFLVNAGHQLALITSLPFVHTARRSYRFRVIR